MSRRTPVVVVFGPTAVGKTELLLSLFTGRGEVVSADSMQVYRGMEIGTAKPAPDERLALPHHLIDILDPDTQFTVGDFVRLTDTAVASILERRMIPVVSGGTAYYLKTWLYGLAEAPPSDPEIRARLLEEAGREGDKALHRRLAGIDPVSAARIPVADRYRIVRALEVHRLTGLPLSSFRVPDRPRDELVPLLVGLDRDRQDLYARIDRRVDEMFERGLENEVRNLIRSGFGANDPGMQAIGYREFFTMSASGCLTLRELRETIKRSSRRYAKRQLTFFRSLPGVRWFHPERDRQAVADEVERFVSREYSEAPS